MLVISIRKDLSLETVQGRLGNALLLRVIQEARRENVLKVKKCSMLIGKMSFEPGRISILVGYVAFAEKTSYGDAVQILVYVFHVAGASLSWCPGRCGCHHWSRESEMSERVEIK